MESPLLYVLFVADLIEYLNSVHLTDSATFLGNRPIRALQLADDLVEHEMHRVRAVVIEPTVPHQTDHVVSA